MDALTGGDRTRCDAGPPTGTAGGGREAAPWASTSVAQARARQVRVNMRYAPEFVVGALGSPTNLTFFWSPTCTDTRDLYGGVMKAFIARTAADRKAAVFVHLHPRNDRDVEISRILLSIEPRFYARYVLALLERFVAQRREIAAAEVRGLASEKRLAFDRAFNERTAASVIQLDHYTNYEGARVRETPSLFLNGDRAIHPRSLDELLAYLRRRGSYAG